MSGVASAEPVAGSRAGPADSVRAILTSEAAVLAAMLLAVGLLYLGPGAFSVVVGLLVGIAIERWRLKRDCKQDHLIAVAAVEILNEIGFTVAVNHSSDGPEIIVRDGEGEVRYRTR